MTDKFFRYIGLSINSTITFCLHFIDDRGDLDGVNDSIMFEFWDGLTNIPDMLWFLSLVAMIVLSWLYRRWPKWFHSKV